MPQKKLTAVAIPHLAEGEWWDAVLPGLILRVGKKRRSWSVRYHANGSYHRKPLGHFPAMELAEARDAARRVIERADRGLPAEAPAPHPRSADVLTLGDLFDRYEALRIREGRKIKTLPMRRCGCCGGLNLAPYLSLPADQFSKADLRAARDDHGRSRYHARRQPPAATARPGAEMGGTGRPDPGQLHAGHPQSAGVEAHPHAHRRGDQGDLGACDDLDSTRGGKELRPHGQILAADGAAHG